MKINEVIVEDAGGVGVIASKKQANDPRYKTSLTVDVKPDTMKKAIAAYFPTQPQDARQHQVHESSNDPVAIDSTSPISGDEELTEIERLSRSDYTGGKETLYPGMGQKRFMKLPGGSGLLYTIEMLGTEPTIKLWDPTAEVAKEPKPVKRRLEFPYEYQARLMNWKQRTKGGPQIIGKLTLEDPWGFPIPKALQVGTITVDEDYRGIGLAKALYGIVLTIMKRPLVAGGSQTPGGRRNWVSLSQIPGVEMKGYVSIDDYELKTRQAKDRYDINHNKSVEHRIDTIMGKLGGQYIGHNRRRGTHYFAFDVKPTTTKQELEAYVKQNLVRVYDENYNTTSGLYAVWTGQ